MIKRAFVLLLTILLTASAVSCSGISSDNNNPVTEAASTNKTGINDNNSINGSLRITFIDVGQGDSELVQNGSSVMLIDCGTNESTKKVIAQLKKNGIKKIDILVGTHPHEDHIGGMDTVIKQFDIGKIYMPKVTTNTKTFRDVIKAIKKKGLKISNPVPGADFKLGDAKVTILAPNSNKYEDFNNYSIVLRILYEKTSFLFTGDAQTLSEQEIMKKRFDLKSDVLKVGHHGSHSSTSGAFLNRVNPRYAVISCGKKNDYGHPHKVTIGKLQVKGVKVFRTDENGTIVCTSDGKDITFSAQPGTFKCGDEEQ